jgi:hypothetical protein
MDVRLGIHPYNDANMLMSMVGLSRQARERQGLGKG